MGFNENELSQATLGENFQSIPGIILQRTLREISNITPGKESNGTPG